MSMKKISLLRKNGGERSKKKENKEEDKENRKKEKEKKQKMRAGRTRGRSEENEFGYYITHLKIPQRADVFNSSESILALL